MPQAHGWNRSIVALLVSIFSSTAAALVCTTALGKQVYDLTHEEIHLGLLGLFEFAPSFVLVLVTGTVSDRVDRRVVASASAIVQGAVGVLLAVLAATGPRTVLPIFGLVLVFGVGRAFLAPSNRALPAELVPPERLPWLTARRGATWQSAIIAGPVLGGTLYAIDPVAPYVAMTLLMVVAAVAMGFVHTERTPGRTARPGLHDAVEGLRYVRGTPVLLGAISLDLFAVLFGGAVALLPALATDRLGAGAVGLGWLRGAGGIGAAAVTLAITRRQVRRHVGRTLLVVIAIFGVFTIVLGATRTYAVAFLAMAVLSGADAVSVFIRSTLTPLVTPLDKLGRVIAVESVFIGASNELGAFESGVAGQLLGASGAVILGGAATLVVAGVYWAAFPALRTVDRFPRTSRPALEPEPDVGAGPPVT